MAGRSEAQRPLVVLSHLRWSWVWQRPQHLIARLGAGRTTLFVEEPVRAAVQRPVLKTAPAGPVIRAWLEVPDDGETSFLSFEKPYRSHYQRGLTSLLQGFEAPIAWLYAPLALEIARDLEPCLLIYDVMDDLAAFEAAPPAMTLAQHQAVATADLVFTGGLSLHAGLGRRAAGRAHLFASGVEPEHFAPAREIRARRRPGPLVAGYVGVIDERVDHHLLQALAGLLPDWELRMVGPVAKVRPEQLAKAPNLHYLGMQPYSELPRVMGNLDVALMPFALNDSTRSISPTKTLEYAAAGLPVVSTRVADVVAEHSGWVRLADDAAGFAAGCRELAGGLPQSLEAESARVVRQRTWDSIASRMAALIEAQLATSAGSEAASA